MSVQRLFLISPSLARLILRERTGEHVREGYFPDQLHRRLSVQVTETGCSLILSHSAEGSAEERADIPLAHAQALLVAARGQMQYLRTTLIIGSREFQLQHFITPGPLDLISVQVEPEDQERPPMLWLGPEVSAEPAYRLRRLALDGVPDAPEVEPTDAALNSLLDLLEARHTTGPVADQAAAHDGLVAEQSVSSDPAMSMPLVDLSQDVDDLGIEDDVIRELARSLRPRRA